MEEVTKMQPIYCCGQPHDNSAMLAELINAKSQGADAATMSALFARGNGGERWDNPFMYLVWLALLGGNGLFGNRGEGGAQGVEINAKLDALANQMQNNQNSNLMMDAINGNHEALHSIANTLGVSFAQMQGAIGQVQNAITQVGGQVGMSAQQIINSVLLGNKDLTQALQSCCCENKLLVTQQGYENRIAGMENTRVLNERLTGVANGIQQGFSSVAYESQRQTCDIINAGNANTQRIIDTLNNHWSAELQQKYADARLELSQQAQNAYLISQLKTTA